MWKILFAVACASIISLACTISIEPCGWVCLDKRTVTSTQTFLLKSAFTLGQRPSNTHLSWAQLKCMFLVSEAVRPQQGHWAIVAMVDWKYRTPCRKTALAERLHFTLLRELTSSIRLGHILRIGFFLRICTGYRFLCRILTNPTWLLGYWHSLFERELIMASTVTLRIDQNSQYRISTEFSEANRSSELKYSNSFLSNPQCDCVKIEIPRAAK